MSEEEPREGLEEEMTLSRKLTNDAMAIGQTLHWRGSRLVKTPLTYQFEMEEDLQSVPRGAIHLDANFFLHGISPGAVLDIKGPEQSGKTFLLTYFIARLLTNYPEKKAVLIDTRHKFTVKNFLSIVSKLDHGLNHNLVQQNLDASTEDLINIFPKLEEYLNRLLVIRCYSAEDLMLALGPSGESVLEDCLLKDPSIGLVAIDAVDAYSFAMSLDGRWKTRWPGTMESLKQAVSHTKCPVFCTTAIPGKKYEYRLTPPPAQEQKNLSGRSDGSRGSSGGRPKSSSDSNCSQQEDQIESNFKINYTNFTKTLEIIPTPATAQVKSQSKYQATANLWSRQSANTAGSGENHRVKFSIFSDILEVMK